MTGLIITFCLTGLFLALMDTKQFFLDASPVFRFFNWLGLSEWYLATGGNKRWRKFWLVWDFWHVCKNLMLISIGVGCEFAASSGLTWELVFIVPPTIGTSFIIFFHGVFGAKWE